MAKYLCSVKFLQEIMNLIIRKAKVIDPKSNFHNQIVDLKIVDGKFEKIGSDLSNSDNLEEIKLENLHVSQGWTQVFALANQVLKTEKLLQMV